MITTRIDAPFFHEIYCTISSRFTRGIQNLASLPGLDQTDLPDTFRQFVARKRAVFCRLHFRFMQRSKLPHTGKCRVECHAENVPWSSRLSNSTMRFHRSLHSLTKCAPIHLVLQYDFCIDFRVVKCVYEIRNYATRRLAKASVAELFWQFASGRS
jgi:hypothetical protein